MDSNYHIKRQMAKIEKAVNPTYQQPRRKIKPKNLYENFFLPKFKEMNGFEFLETEESKRNMLLLIYYFCNDPRFFANESGSLVTSFRSRKLEPTFKKGLLIIGTYGTGKSSIMRVFEEILQPCHHAFKIKDANDLVTEYESFNTAQEKELFNRDNVKQTFKGIDKKTYLRKPRLFDDVKTEKHASNYGKVNLIKQILEQRYSREAKTHIICNYKTGHDNNLEEGLKEFAELYGTRVYDRLFSMFNILEFKGKSFRK